MTYLPRADYFDSPDHLLPLVNQEEGTEEAEIEAANEEEINLKSSFETPLRSSTLSTQRHSFSNRLLPSTNTVNQHHSNFRNKRPISDEEAFRVMEELAFEVGRTVRKEKSDRVVVKEEESEEEITELESRRIEILRELNDFDIRLEELLRLTRG